MRVMVHCSSYKKFMHGVKVEMAHNASYTSFVNCVTQHLHGTGYPTVVYRANGDWEMSGAEYTLFLLRWS